MRKEKGKAHEIVNKKGKSFGKQKQIASNKIKLDGM